MINKLLDQLLAETYTRADALSRLRALKDLFLVEMFGSAQEIKPQTSRRETPGQHTPWIVSLGSSIRRYFNRDNVYQLFDSLEEEIKKIKSLVIYLPSIMPEEGTVAIGKHLRKTYGTRFLMEIKVDPSLLAGCGLVWNGIYKDYSIRQKIDGNRTKILEMIKEELR